MEDNPFNIDFKGVDLNEDLQTEFNQFLKNGLYYQGVGNAAGALVSYSNAEAYLHFMKVSGMINDGKIEAFNKLEQKLLGYIEQLTEKTKSLVKSGGGGKQEEKEDWQEVCKSVTPKFASGGEVITYTDVIGLDKQKADVQSSFIDPLLMPNLFPALSKGILFYGPPGTGKTYLVKAMINALQGIDPSIKVLFFDPTGADLKGKYVGETEKRITKYFSCASRAACVAMSDNAKTGKKQKVISILFIDEFDSVGGDRSTDETGLVANSVNTLLQMMDGVQSFKNVAVVAATNYPWNLDSAILRRFGNQVFIDVPKSNDIKELLKYEYYRNISIKAFNLWCYCKDPDLKLDFKADPSMDALCDTNISIDKDVTIDEENIHIDIDFPDGSEFYNNVVKNTNGFEITIVIYKHPGKLSVNIIQIKGIVLKANDEGRYILTKQVKPKGGPPTRIGGMSDIPLDRILIGYNNTTRKRRNGEISRYGYKAPETVIQEGGADEVPRVTIKIEIINDATKTNGNKKEWIEIIKSSSKIRDLPNVSPYKMFSLNDFTDSDILDEAATKMSEKNYSNSDITNLMARVCNESGKRASKLGIFVNYNLLSRNGNVENSILANYYISALSKPKDTSLLRSICNAGLEYCRTGKFQGSNPFYMKGVTASKVNTIVNIGGKLYYNAKFFPGLELTRILSCDRYDDLYLPEQLVIDYIDQVDKLDINTWAKAEARNGKIEIVTGKKITVMNNSGDTSIVMNKREQIERLIRSIMKIFDGTNLLELSREQKKKNTEQKTLFQKTTDLFVKKEIETNIKIINEKLIEEGAIELEDEKVYASPIVTTIEVTKDIISDHDTATVGSRGYPSEKMCYYIYQLLDLCDNKTHVSILTGLIIEYINGDTNLALINDIVRKFVLMLSNTIEKTNIDIKVAISSIEDYCIIEKSYSSNKTMKKDSIEHDIIVYVKSTIDVDNVSFISFVNKNYFYFASIKQTCMAVISGLKKIVSSPKEFDEIFEKYIADKKIDIYDYLLFRTNSVSIQRIKTRENGNDYTGGNNKNNEFKEWFVDFPDNMNKDSFAAHLAKLGIRIASGAGGIYAINAAASSATAAAAAAAQEAAVAAAAWATSVGAYGATSAGASATIATSAAASAASAAANAASFGVIAIPGAGLAAASTLVLTIVAVAYLNSENKTNMNLSNYSYSKSYTKSKHLSSFLIPYAFINGMSQETALAQPTLVGLKMLLDTNVCLLADLDKDLSTGKLLNNIMEYTCKELENCILIGSSFKETIPNDIEIYISPCDETLKKTGRAGVGEKVAVKDVLSYDFKNPENVDSRQLLNFCILPSVIIPSMKDFPSTYDKSKGKYYSKYANDRETFLANREWVRK
jgi:hypothetical protein